MDKFNPVLGIILAAFARIIVSTLWYSPAFFGIPWQLLTGHRIDMNRVPNFNSQVASFLIALVQCTFLGLLLLFVPEISPFLIGFAFWVSALLPVYITEHLFSEDIRNPQLVWLHGGHELALTMVSILILTQFIAK